MRFALETATVLFSTPNLAKGAWIGWKAYTQALICKTETFPQGSSCWQEIKIKNIRVARCSHACYLWQIARRRSTPRRRWSLLYPAAGLCTGQNSRFTPYLGIGCEVRWLGRRSITATTCSMIPRVWHVRGQVDRRLR